MMDYFSNFNKIQEMLSAQNKWKNLFSLQENFGIGSELSKSLKNLYKPVFDDSITKIMQNNLLGLNTYKELLKKNESLFSSNLLTNVSKLSNLNLFSNNWKKQFDKLTETGLIGNNFSKILSQNNFIYNSNKYIDNLSKSLISQKSLFDKNIIKMNLSMYGEVKQFNNIFNNRNTIVEKIQNELKFINYSELNYLKSELKESFNIDFDDLKNEVKDEINSFKDDLINYIDNKVIPKKDSMIKNIILYILLNIFLECIVFGYITNITSQDLKENIDKIVFNKDKNTLKSIKNETIEYRCVSADCLNVRKCNSSDSAIIGKLYKNEIVIVQKIKKDWALIEKIENDTIIKGWVFTRYIKKYKQHGT